MTIARLLRCMTAVALAALTSAGAAPGGSSFSEVSDPEGDTLFQSTPAFQDFVLGRMTKTAGGDYELFMELAAPIPAAPPLPAMGQSEIWWFWILDLDPTAGPEGYPWNNAVGRPPEFIVCVSWDGDKFAGTAIDRRPLLTGGEAIVTPVPFSINGTIVEACLDSEVIGAVPASFLWGPFTSTWSGPVGSEGFNFADYLESGTVNNP